MLQKEKVQGEGILTLDYWKKLVLSHVVATKN